MKKIVSFLALTMLVACVAQSWAGKGVESTNKPLCFTAVGGNVTVRFDIKNVTHTIQYSTDSSTWNTYTPNDTIALAAGGRVFFRAESNQAEATAFGHDNYLFDSMSYFRFATNDSATVQGSGNIMSLYGPDCPDLPLPPYAFSCLFAQGELLTTAPDLPATTLGTACYYGMFSYCTGLSKAPDLPAATAGTGSYAYMFCACPSIITAPDLPATTLAPFCYNGMFCDCTGLTNPPALAATEMVSGACYLMFDHCTALRTPPALSCSSLADSCYWGMFRDCSALTSLPDLPATTLTKDCYSQMFYGCSSLEVNTSGPGHAWSISAAQPVCNVFDSMFFGTAGTMNLTPEVNTVYYVASDTSAVGIVPAAEDHTAVFAREGYLRVNGSEGERVRVYDVAGRLLLTDRCTPGMKLRMPVSGIYLVQVGDRPARRVMVAR